MSFLFHKISEKEKEEIRKQVRSIIDSFSTKLSKIDKDVKEDFIERENCEREEKRESKENDGDFSREIMFENAPEKNKDFIIGEKKKW